jgi:hypothetical protein
MCWLVLTASLAWGQDAALKDRVQSLVQRLASGSATDRDLAEAALTKLGARAVDLLPAELPASADDDARLRLARLREGIASATVEASKVTIEGTGIRLSDALRQLQAQSHNPITDLREAYGGEASNPVLDLDLKDASFFEALDAIAEKAGVSVSFFTGDGSVGIMPGPSPGDMYGRTQRPPIRYAGPFRIALNRIGSIRDFNTAEARTNVQFEVAWEPRLRPMLLALKSDRIKIVDDQDHAVEPDIREESTNAPLRPENPAAELNLNLKAPDRAARSLKTLTVEADVTVPAGQKRFTFPKIDRPKVTQTQGDVSLTLEDFEVSENVWKLRVRLAMPGSGPVFETYRQGLFNNQIWLQKPDGSRFEQNGGFSTLGAAEGMLAFEYLFVDAPGTPADWALVYETPGKVVEIPLSFTFEDVNLP